MTDLTKPVVRRVTATDGTVLIVSIGREGIYFREPRRRTAFLLPYPTAVRVAGKMAGEALLASRKKARRVR